MANIVATPCQIRLGDVLTNIEYKVLKIIGAIMRVIESNTLKAPINWPIWDGATTFVCNDFIVGTAAEPNEAVNAARLNILKKLERRNVKLK